MKLTYLLLTLLAPTFVSAQILQLGKAVVTCEGVNASDFVVRILETRNPQNAPLGYDWPTPKRTHADWVKGSNASPTGCTGCTGLGTLFGISYDQSTPPNIYVAATNIYKSTAFGFSGAGAIYKLDKTTGAATGLTGTSSTFINHSTTATRMIWNTGSALGNICQSADLKYMFATNFEDGKIYKVNTGSGIVLATYDPFSDDDKVSGYCPLGERIWAVAVYEGRLYFSRWAEDAQHTTTGIRNGIYSIALDSAQNFPGALNADGSYHDGQERLEIVGGTALIPNYPNNLSSYAGTTASYPNLNNITAPISDIEFSSDGKMLIAERSMPGDKVNSNFDFHAAHFSRVFEFERNGSNWQKTTNFFVGNIYANTNSAGGIDYGYGRPGCDSGTKQIYSDGSFALYQQDGFNEISSCEQLVWSTGDALRYPDYNPSGNVSNYNNTIYGIAGLPITGNSNLDGSAEWAKTTSIYVDLDSVWNVPKAGLGDVDIYRLSCITSDCTTSGVISAENFSNNKLSPNPASSEIYLDLLDNFDSPVSIRVVDLTGKVISEITSQSKRTIIPLTNIAAGQYLLQIKQNEKERNLKFVVSK